jgi:putative addiction module killer protein
MPKAASHSTNGLTTLTPKRRAKFGPLAQIEAGNMSEVKPVGGGVSERRIHWGKGLRIYFAQDGKTIIVLLGGGDQGDTNPRH